MRGDTRRVDSIYRSTAGREHIRRWCTDRLDAWPVPHERTIVTANGAETHLVSSGSGPTTVVFVPGTNFNAAASLPLATSLVAAGHRLVLPDVPGQPGLSSGERAISGGRLSWYGTWLSELLDACAATGPVVVIGHSFGAAIALSSPSPRIDRLVLVSPGGLCRLRLTPGLLAVSAAWFVRPTPARSTRLLRAMLAPGHQPREELVEWMTLVARHSRSRDGFGGPLHVEVASRCDVLPLVHRIVGVNELACLREQPPREEVGRGPVVLAGGVLAAGPAVVLQCPPDQLLVVREVIGEPHDGRLGGRVAFRGGGERAQGAADGLLRLSVEATRLGVRLFQAPFAGTGITTGEQDIGRLRVHVVEREVEPGRGDGTGRVVLGRLVPSGGRARRRDREQDQQPGGKQHARRASEAQSAGQGLPVAVGEQAGRPGDHGGRPWSRRPSSQLPSGWRTWDAHATGLRCGALRDSLWSPRSLGLIGTGGDRHSRSSSHPGRSYGPACTPASGSTVRPTRHVDGLHTRGDAELTGS
ncbi:alpha/beta hydrolase [Streptomyces virginiae]|nr:alpha/beta hydrolase [Streptomyces virginiae]